MAQQDRPLLGIGLVIVATGFFVTMDTTVKSLSMSIPILVAVWFRYLCQAIGMTLVVVPLRGMQGLRTSRPWAHVLRGVLMVLSTALGCIGLQDMSVADLTAIFMLTPLTVTLLAVLFLGERVNGFRWVLVFGGFVGAMLVIRPGSSGLGWTALFPLAGMLLYSVFHILTSRLIRSEDPMVLHMTSGWVGMLLMSAALPWIWQQHPDDHAWRLLLLVGFTGAVGHLLLILAYSKARAAHLAPYMYMQIVFAVLSGWLVFDHVPKEFELLGIALIVVCGACAGWLGSSTSLGVRRR